MGVPVFVPGAGAVGRRLIGPGVSPISKEVLRNARRTRPRHRDVVQFLLQDRRFLRISFRYFHELPVAHWLTEPQQMQPIEAASTWDVPAIESVGSLADWLRITLGDLEWFADLKGRGYKKSSQQLRHYHYRILAKQSGSIRLEPRGIRGRSPSSLGTAWGSAGLVFSSAFAEGRTYFTGACQALYLPRGLPLDWPGKISWRGVHAIRRRSCIFRQRSIGGACRAVLNARCCRVLGAVLKGMKEPRGKPRMFRLVGERPAFLLA
jgi:hypothetical protein